MNPDTGPLPKRVLILGASGFVGRHLLARLGTRAALGTYCHRPLEGGVFFDAAAGDLAGAIKTPQDFSHAVILLGDTKPDSCARDPDRSHALNVAGIARLLGVLRGWGLVPVFASTDCVFGGRKGDYREEDVPDPILLYGKQKVAIEQQVQAKFPEYLVVRLSKVLGTEERDGTLLTNWASQIARGETIRCAKDQLFSPVYIGDVVEALLRLMAAGKSGVFHVCGAEATTHLGLVERLAKRAAKPPRIEACSINDFDLLEKRPLNISMRPDKLTRTIGLTPTPLESLCDRVMKRV